MLIRHHRILFTCLLWLQLVHGGINLCANEFSIDPVPIAEIINPCPDYSLTNSVEFHPKKNLCCVTYTHGNRVVLYEIDGAGKPVMIQSLENPLANLSEPQHAAFSPDGEKLIVANWTNQTLTIYKCDESGLFCATPAALIPSPSLLTNHKPHGIAFSPCGNFLAIAYGASKHYGRAITLFRLTDKGTRCDLVSLLQGTEELPGTPKGITFSPDGTCLLVTFSDTNSLVIYGLVGIDKTVLPTFLQCIQGEETGIFRPEDVKITPNGNYCAITNSSKHTVTFYPFDKTSNRVTQSTPYYTLQNPEAHLCFPHGISFSPDGSFVLITEFGPIITTENGGIAWEDATEASQAKVYIYRT